MASDGHQAHIYDGDADRRFTEPPRSDRIVLLPGAQPSQRCSSSRRIRILWGDPLLDDLLAGRYRSLICAVNPQDNQHGIICQLARLLPTSQWSESAITALARRFQQPRCASVVKYDMDVVEILALVRGANHDHLTLEDLGMGFQMLANKLDRCPSLRPSASVCFLGARANRLIDEHGLEPSFETVLRTMHEAGYGGDVYPAPSMWKSAPTAVFASYPFPESVNLMREGGF